VYQLTSKVLSDFRFESTAINEALVMGLAGGSFLAQHCNLVPTGGTGHRHLASAIARFASAPGPFCRRVSPVFPRWVWGETRNQCRCIIYCFWRIFGEPAGIRTQDLLIKSQLLCQLSYGLLGAGEL
jgi:hypothetical protein